MIKHRVKLTLAITGLLVASAGLAFGISRLGRIIEHFGTGADPAAALQTTDPPGVGTEFLTWRPDLPQPARDLEPATRRAVSEGYARAWDEVASGPATDYITGPAGAAIAADSNAGAAMSHLSHTLQLEFYSADGQVLVMTDQATVARAVPVDSGRLLTVGNSEAHRAIMLLEDGNWRLRSLTRLDGGIPSVQFIDDPRPPGRLYAAGGTLVVALLVFVPLKGRGSNQHQTKGTSHGL